MTDIEEPTEPMLRAVREALALTEGQGLGYGVGVATGEAFVQWYRADDGALTHVEVQPNGRPEVVAALVERGFSEPDYDFLRDLGIWSYDDDRPFDGARSDEDVVEVVTALLALVSSAGATYTAYP